MLRNNAAEKAEIYETLASMNRAFAGIITQLESFRQTRAITSKYARLFQGFTQEVQAEINLEVLEGMGRIEMEDWARFGKVRQKWEKYLRDPDDVFIHAEERRKELNKQRKKTFVL
jgi:hypothetical protein